MIINTDRILVDMEPEKEFLVAIDSDGCAFDAMGIKQRECFCPMMIAYFDLQSVAEAARECKMFADLFSKTRGANRHKTIVRILTELLPSHPMVKSRGFKVPEFKYYCEWVNDPDTLLSDAGLKKAIDESSNSQQKEELYRALKWSQRVNEMVAEVVKDVSPFSYVREALEKISKQADIMVCSATPIEALEREWEEHGLKQYVKVIAGQEMGSKAQHLSIVSDNKYSKKNIIMLGDALGDLDAAKRNHVHFYPVIPGREDFSWQKFYDEAFEHFITGRYKGEYEDSVIAEFENCLPNNPNWLGV